LKRKRGAHNTRSRTDGIRLDAPDVPSEGGDAGSDDDLQEHYLTLRIRHYRGLANRRFANARRLQGEGSPRAEPEARRAIDAAVRAFWWAEDTELEDAQHTLVHKVGRWTRRTFGCYLDYDGKRYRQLCPIAIAHKRLGFSIGFVGPRTCSICGQDLSECEHIRGRTYWVRGGAHDSRPCAVCVQPLCRHLPDRLYRAPVVSIISEIDEVREVSVVGRPAVPEARLQELPIETSALRERFGSAFHEGVRISCDLCLGACWGFDGLPSTEMRSGSVD
jgi:hypothetical protein